MRATDMRLLWNLWTVNLTPPESAEYKLGNVLQDRGYLVQWDCENLLNYEEYRWVGTHVWENNGLATKIRIH